MFYLFVYGLHNIHQVLTTQRLIVKVTWLKNFPAFRTSMENLIGPKSNILHLLLHSRGCWTACEPHRASWFLPLKFQLTHFFFRGNYLLFKEQFLRKCSWVQELMNQTRLERLELKIITPSPVVKTNFNPKLPTGFIQSGYQLTNFLCGMSFNIDMGSFLLFKGNLIGRFCEKVQLLLVFEKIEPTLFLNYRNPVLF